MGGRCETISALTQIDLVEVQLQNLIFAQRLLDFVGQQGFVELTGERTLAAQVEVFGNLLRNRTGTGLDAAGHDVADRGARHTPNVHAPVVVEAFVFGGNHGIFQNFGKVTDFGEFTPLLAVNANHLAV